MRALYEAGEDEKVFELFPRNALIYGERLKAMILQKKPNASRPHPHIWVTGLPGTGKTAIMQLVYPKMYKKDLNNRFFDLYNQDYHTHVMLEDLDHQNVEKLGIQFLKTLCDEAGFPIDQKYKTPQLARTTVLVTSNFTINAVVPEGKGVDETKMALHRRFMQLHVLQLYQILGLQLINKFERNQLKLRGITDIKALFMTWDYARQMPTGEEVQDAEYYQEKIIEYYYKQ